MGVIHFKAFSDGVDARRMPATTAAGSLIVGFDGHINRGGDFEQRAAFTLKASLPAGTIGLAADATQLVVFGSDPAPALPAGFAYQRLQHGARTLVRVPSWDLFGDLVYAAAIYDDGARMHFYNATLIAEWNPHPLGVLPGDFVLTHDTKVYSLSNTVVAFSAVDNPIDLNGTGAGAVDMARQARRVGALQALAPYQQNLAVMAKGVIIIFYFDVDPTKSARRQVLQGVGTEDPASATPFGDMDVFFLDSSGIRSLRARDSSLAAATSDVGVFIDDLVVAQLATRPAERIGRAIGLIEPTSNNLWMIIDDRIYVFAFFPGSKISAWSVYRPGFVVDDAVVFNNRVYLRSGNFVYVYGGEDGALQYDSTEARAVLAYADAGKPSMKKTWDGVDVACVGSWEIRIGHDPDNLEASDKVAEVDSQTTFGHDRIPYQHEATHASLQFVSAGPGYKKISAAALHYEGTDDEG